MILTDRLLHKLTTTLFVVLTSFFLSSFRNSCEDPETIARIFIDNLIRMDASKFESEYSISQTDINWFTDKVKLDSLSDEEMKKELFSFLNTQSVQSHNANLMSKYKHVWIDNINKYNIDTHKIQFVESKCVLTNQKNKNVLELGLTIKFRCENQYYTIEVDPLFKLNNK